MSDENSAGKCSLRALHEAMGGFHVLAWDAGAKALTAGFTVRPEFCHTNATIAQGGFITAWLDAAMATAVLYDSDKQLNVASLEIKVTFLERVGPGPGTAMGRIVRRGNRVAFLTGDLFNADGKLAAQATSTGLIIPMTPLG